MCEVCTLRIGDRQHLIFANIFVGAKHSGSKSLLITNKLSAVMLRPSNIGMHPIESLELRLINPVFARNFGLVEKYIGRNRVDDTRASRTNITTVAEFVNLSFFPSSFFLLPSSF